jgi:hypothetical protein
LPTIAANVAAEAIAARSPRGAWIEQGVVDPTNRILQLFAAEDMTITIGDQVHRIKEDEYLRVFQGEIAPPERIIRSETFARNVEALAAYLEL